MNENNLISIDITKFDKYAQKFGLTEPIDLACKTLDGEHSVMIPHLNEVGEMVYSQNTAQQSFIFNLENFNANTHQAVVFVKDYLVADIFNVLLPEFCFCSIVNLDSSSSINLKPYLSVIDSIKDIIVFSTDVEFTKRFLSSDLVNRFGEEKLKRPLVESVDFTDIEAIKKLLSDRASENIDGLQYGENLIDIDNFYNSERKHFAITGFWGIDKRMAGIRNNELTLVLGRSNEGKSTLTSQFCLNFLGQDQSVFLYSGEMNNRQVIDWLASPLLNYKSLYKIDYDEWLNPKRIYTEPALKAMKTYLGKRLIVIDNKLDENDLISKMELAYRRDNVKIFILDNLMSAVQSGDDFNTSKMEFVKKLTAFKNKFNVHIFLVAHPNKGKGINKKLSKFDISGLSDVVNLADNVITITRNFKDGEEGVESSNNDSQEELSDGELGVNKSRETGTLGNLQISYIHNTRTFEELNVESHQVTKVLFNIKDTYNNIVKEQYDGQYPLITDEDVVATDTFISDYITDLDDEDYAPEPKDEMEEFEL